MRILSLKLSIFKNEEFGMGYTSFAILEVWKRSARLTM